MNIPTLFNLIRLKCIAITTVVILTSCVSAQELFQKGVAEEQAGNQHQAFDYYTLAIKADTNFVKAYNNRALIYMQQDQLSLATADLDTALNIDANYGSALVNRGTVYEKQGDLKSAYTLYEKATKTTPDLVAGHFNAAKAALSLRLINEAARHIEAAEKLVNHEPVVDLLAGRIYMAANHPQKAYDLFNRLYQNDANDSEALAGLIESSIQLNRHSEAVKHAEQLVKVRPNCADCIVLLSSLYIENNQKDTATNTLAKAVENPNFASNTAIRYRLALLYASTSQNSKAIAQLEDYLKLRGDETDDEATSARTLLESLRKK